MPADKTSVRVQIQCEVTMAIAVSYSEFPAPSPLQDFVECFWSLTPGPDSEAVHHLAFPDGCVDIVLAPGGLIQISGATTKAVSWLVRPRQPITGARLRVGCVPTLMGISANEIRDLVVPLDLIWGSAVRRLADSLEPQSNLMDRIGTLGRFLAGAAEKVGKPVPPLISHCVKQLSVPAEQSHLGSLAAEVGYSERQLRRAFEHYVGISPKRYGRIMRFQRLLDRLRRGPQLTWANLAQSCGYADQPHLIREVREFAGVAPTSLLCDVVHS
jgi:AraC-like DNA-binding protein